MEQMLICLSIALIAGLLMSRLAKAVNLPAVTSYLVAGLLLGPFVLGRLGLSGLGIGFGSLEQVEGYGVVTQVALGFIAFVIGNEFRLSSLRSMGQQAITVGIAQAVITTALVDVALVGVHLLFPQVLSLASAITLGSIAAATAPAATLMVVKQYKANGPLTHLLLMVVAIDDAVGLVLFSASYGVANALEQGHMDLLSVVVEPLMEILLSLLLGAVAGYLLNLLEVYFHSRSKRMSLSVAFVLFISIYLIISGLPAILKVGPIKFLFGQKWAAGTENFGILSFILTSIYGTAGAVVIGVPLGIMTAVFLAKVAPPKLAKVIHTAVELLAGIPSVVYGLVGMIILVPGIQKAFGLSSGACLLAAILVLAIMILPSIISVSETALRAVPEDYEQASLALGATHLETVFRVTVPAARSGVATAIVLGVGRAIGEAMAIIMVAGNVANMPGLFQSVRFLTTAIASEMSYASVGSLQRNALFSIGLVLFLFIMLINVFLNVCIKRKKEA